MKNQEAEGNILLKLYYSFIMEENFLVLSLYLENCPS